ncbi:NAD(P)H-dependent glycerol-3-phosphate dehydrogenase [Candidatus Oleimmundimicrobium sp.]|uniref:NAD(P)H-dependent glycerol-3-phosphate dehydrogenase n=1 Tax=Candidatus Oleimmundimicrobium sp. TaxID=3060597 RepID=UPI00271B4670|nr:NAD(P)H-dependent glycerol-3-phosphate dehydrogenase [Candidatus Oleimmundimicrobium sp.]MDO8885307.1 NAD(P)H-dependent glycerol-3-phosphate dehydrogenase [Candidatus Oleimmundimicrobium sp.]
MAKKVNLFRLTEKKIAVIGAGSWGTAISILLAKKGFVVSLWARDEKFACEAQSKRSNPRYLPNVIFPENLDVSFKMDDVVKGAEVIALVVPSHGMREVVKKLKSFLKDQIIISLAKGIEVDTLMRMSEVIASELPEKFFEKIAVISGPNHAEEVSLEIPSTTVVSAHKKEVALKVQNMFMTPYFRVYTNPDIIGVEVGGATKNIIALATGMSDGLGYGDNTRASLMTRGLAEMTRLGLNMGAQSSTFAGLSGMGDLIATCTSRHSRNRNTGEKIAKGMTLEEVTAETKMVAEGTKTTKAVYRLAEKRCIDMPITRAVYQVLYENKRPLNCVSDLMMRGAKDELKAFGY